MTLHPLPPSASGTPSPERFTFPFCYTPHPLCVAAAEEVRKYVLSQERWAVELRMGKMFGVLIVRHGDERGFLAAFSGTLEGKTRHAYFVPPVFDLMAEGCFFQSEQKVISSLNVRIADLEARLPHAGLHDRMEEELSAYRAKMMVDKQRRDALRTSLPAAELEEMQPELVRESQFQKAQLHRLKQEWRRRMEDEENAAASLKAELETLKKERKERSAALQRWLFRQFSFLNADGERADLEDIFRPAVPPSGAGECCAPRLLQAAYLMQVRPLCMAEFWVGGQPADSFRQDGHFYPSCNARCKPILRHMMKGLDVDANPLLRTADAELEVVCRTEDMAVVGKPHGMLSVMGKDGLPSVQTEVRRLFPDATGPMIVHRLDMDTSGLMAVALTPDAYRRMQEAFLRHSVRKTYRALLERPMTVGQEGEIRLPLRPDVMDRPRQTVDMRHGRTAVTRYCVADNVDGHALVLLEPVTGRTHQLRVHCAHPDGLGNPILGDRLYGHPSDTYLHLQAYRLEIEGKEFIYDRDI